VAGLQNKLNITGTADPNGVPGINISGFSGFGASTGLIGNLDNIYQIQDGFNWLHGNHQIKFGASIAYLRTIQSSANANARGVFTFNDTYTAQLAPNGSGGYSIVAATGNAFADFLLGPELTTIGMPRTHLRLTTAYPTFRTLGKSIPTLPRTLPSPGSWEHPLRTPADRQESDSRIRLHRRKANVRRLGPNEIPAHPMTMTNWAPRIGINYQPSKREKYSRRADGSVLHNATGKISNTQSYPRSSRSTMPFRTRNPTLLYVLAERDAFGDRGQTGAGAGRCHYRSDSIPEPDEPFPYISQWNLDIQHTFASKYLPDVAYIGNESHHLALN
jgi:hypothetical protein